MTLLDKRDVFVKCAVTTLHSSLSPETNEHYYERCTFVSWEHKPKWSKMMIVHHTFGTDRNDIVCWLACSTTFTADSVKSLLKKSIHETLALVQISHLQFVILKFKTLFDLGQITYLLLSLFQLWLKLSLQLFWIIDKLIKLCLHTVLSENKLESNLAKSIESFQFEKM